MSAIYAVFESVGGRWVLRSRFAGDEQGLSAQERAEMCVEALRHVGREARIEVYGRDGTGLQPKER